MIAIDGQRQRQVDKRLAEMPRAYRATYRKAVEGKSLRACINAFCLECMGWQRDEVRKCTAPACPLWSVRPYRERHRASQEPHKTALKAEL